MAPADPAKQTPAEMADSCRAAAATRVGFLGPLHTYSHSAAIAYFGSIAQWVPLPSISAVFDHLAAGNSDTAVVPLENSADGGIVETLTQFARVPAPIHGEVSLPIRHCLLARDRHSAIRRIGSKAQALSQCRGWLSDHFPDVEWVECASTAAAAAEAAVDATMAAIGSHLAAREYALDIVAEDIQDDPTNVTRFAVLGPRAAARSGKDKTALLVQPNHERPDFESMLAQLGARVIWIQCFSIPVDSREEEMYFVEVEGHAEDPPLRQLMESLARQSRRLDVLGSFARGA